MCLCLDAGILHIKLAGSNKSSGQAGFQHTGAWQKGSQRCGGFDWWHDRHFFWFLQQICRHRKNRRHRNAGNTEYIHVKDRFFAKKMFADVNVLLFPAPVSEGAEEAGWWDQGCEWGLRVGFVRSLFWIFPLPRFSWIELTPYMCRVLFGSWLALRMPLQCPFSKPSGAESQVFKTESGPELYIYICIYKFKTHTQIYIYILMKLCFRVHCSRVSVYICMFRFRYRTYTKYSTGSTKSSARRPSRILKHRSPTKRKPTLWRIRLMTSDGHFLFLPRICRHRKDTRHRNHTI